MILTIFNVLILSIVVMPNQADAAYSKVVSLAAKKAAKELVKDLAVNSAVDMVVQQAVSGDSVLYDKYKVDEGFTLVCLSGGQDGNCDKPLQVKTDLTDTDKNSIGNKAEEILDSKVGMSGWVKFLDWFAPLFLLGTVVTFVVTALDPETKNLFSQVAEETLIALGILKEVTPTSDYEFPETTYQQETTSSGNVEFQDYVQAREINFVSTGANVSTFKMPNPETPGNKHYVHLQRVPSGITSTELTLYTSLASFSPYVNIRTNLIYTLSPNGVPPSSGTENMLATVVYKNGTLIAEGYNTSAYVSSAGLTEQIDVSKITDVIAYPTYQTSEPHRNADHLNASKIYFEKKYEVHDSIGNLFTIYSSVFNTSSIGVSTGVSVKENHGTMTTGNLNFKINVFTDADLYEVKPYQPNIEDLLLEDMKSSSYHNESTGETSIIPPTSIPIKTPEGVPVMPSETSTTGWKDVNTGEDINVNPDTLIVQDPIFTPEGIQLPDGSVLPKPQPEETTNPEEEFDFKENGCEKLEKPDVNPLTTAFTTSFPFSIPWDIKRFIDNAFGGVGSEKPSFELTFLGQGIVLEIPDYFDSWVSFGKGFMIFVFDISILYLFYRFMKGGGD